MGRGKSKFQGHSNLSFQREGLGKHKPWFTKRYQHRKLRHEARLKRQAFWKNTKKLK